MRIALFIPCYIDQCYPNVGMAMVRVLERLGQTDLEFPEAQTCCGQPMANSGCTDAAAPLAQRFVEIFQGYEAIVCPSGSCVSMVRNHFSELLGRTPELAELQARTYEFCEFLTDVLGVKEVTGRFPHVVGLHNSCHGLRELRLGQDSERVGPEFNKMRELLAGLDAIRLSELSRVDECCGFGGTFAVTEEAVSVQMGLDRIADHQQAGTEVLTAGDMSCLMHLEGLIRRRKLPIRVMHVTEVLDEAMSQESTVSATGHGTASEASGPA